MTFRTRAVSVIGLAIALLPSLGGIAFAQLSTDDPGVTVEDGGENCNGIIPTPGSENTVKTLTGGDLNPGGNAQFLISYPVDPTDVGSDWEIVDCVLIGTGSDLKDYDVLDQKTFSGVVNNEFFTLSLNVDIPEDTAIGTTICNVAKTTEGPSAPQASNRKAGPACFVVGGGARVEKQDPEGNLLFGATFEISDCVNNAIDPASQPLIVNPAPDGGGPEGTVVADEGFISFNGASGSHCLVTEVSPPPGYTLPPEDERTQLVTIPVGIDQAIVYVFVDTPVEAAIAVTKDCTGPVRIGETVTYTITVTNTGSDVLENIQVTDSLLGDLSASFPDTLDPGESATEEFDRTVLAGDPDPVVNEVEATAVGATTGDTVEAGDTCETDVTHEPGVSVTKACTGPAGVGDEVTYTITIENTGDEPLVDITVIDSLLGDLSSEFPATIDVGEVVVREFTRVVLETDPDLLENVVTVTAVGEDSLGVVEDTAACASSILRPAIDIDKSGPALAHVGDEVTYTLVVTNIGNTPLDDVVVSDPRCDATPAFIGGDADTDGLLDLDETWTYTCTHVIAEADGDPVPNTATVAGTAETGETVTAEDDHEVDVIHPAIAVVKASDIPIAAPGQVVTFTLTVTNTGDTPLQDVVVDDPLCDSAPEFTGGDLNTDEILDLTETWVFTCTLAFPAGGLPVDNVATVAGTDVLGRTVTDDDTVRVNPILGEPPAKTGTSGLGTIALFGSLFLLTGFVLSAGSRARFPVPVGPGGMSLAAREVVLLALAGPIRAARRRRQAAPGRAGPDPSR